MLGSLPFLPKPDAVAVLPITTGLPSREVAIGRTLVIQQCASCHNVSHQTAITVFNQRLALRSLVNLLERRNLTTADKIENYLKAIGGFPYMHPVVGTDEERASMALYLEYFYQQQQRNPQTAAYSAK
ncbi:hypothetical protein [Chloroflexus sp.]|uniref:hypothetical protein n=1 Tax=Chloroflexus sp. TaxID=1904827 RepID=UPI003D099E6E